MTGRELKKYRQELAEIQKNKIQKERKPKLIELAEKVGASTLARYPTSLPHVAEEPELIEHINEALRTEAMVIACNTASWSFIISIIAVGAAVISALAAWAAVLYN